MPAPSISVIMSVHNGDRYLAQAIESILGQTFADFEFLIVDDGSTDNSAAIVEGYAVRDARIHLISQTNQGVTKSLNRALERAVGEFVARMDADDIALPSRLERQVHELRSSSDLVVVGCEVELTTSDGLWLGSRGHAAQHAEIRRRLLLGDGGALTHPAVMMRASALREIGGYDEAFAVAQDLDLFLRLSEIGRAANLSETLLLWRQHDASINRTRYHTWVAMKRQAIENTIERVGAARFAEALFYQQASVSSLIDALELARQAQSAGRFRSALKLYLRSARRPDVRWTVLKELALLLLRSIRKRSAI